MRSDLQVGTLNINQTATNLKLDFDEWDYMGAPKPQSTAYKAWMKKHLVQGHPVIWFVMCKGDDPCPYKGACPNGGTGGLGSPLARARRSPTPKYPALWGSLQSFSAPAAPPLPTALSLLS